MNLLAAFGPRMQMTEDEKRELEMIAAEMGVQHLLRKPTKPKPPRVSPTKQWTVEEWERVSGKTLCMTWLWLKRKAKRIAKARVKANRRKMIKASQKRNRAA